MTNTIGFRFGTHVSVQPNTPLVHFGLVLDHLRRFSESLGRSLQDVVYLERTIFPAIDQADNSRIKFQSDIAIASFRYRAKNSNFC